MVHLLHNQFQKFSYNSLNNLHIVTIDSHQKKQTNYKPLLKVILWNIAPILVISAHAKGTIHKEIKNYLSEYPHFNIKASSTKKTPKAVHTNAIKCLMYIFLKKRKLKTNNHYQQNHHDYTTLIKKYILQNLNSGY